jgi:hypothetical protein
MLKLIIALWIIGTAYSTAHYKQIHTIYTKDIKVGNSKVLFSDDTVIMSSGTNAYFYRENGYNWIERTK